MLIDDSRMAKGKGKGKGKGDGKGAQAPSLRARRVRSGVDDRVPQVIFATCQFRSSDGLRALMDFQ